MFLGTLVVESGNEGGGGKEEEGQKKRRRGLGVKRQKGSEKGEKGRVPSWDPKPPGKSLLWVRQFSALGMLPRLKRHLKEQTKLRNYIPKE